MPDDLELLTKGREVLSAENFTLLKSTWWTTHCESGAGGCLLGAGLHAFALTPQDFYDKAVPDGLSWSDKTALQLRLAALLMPYIDLTLAAEVLSAPESHYTVKDLEAIPGSDHDKVDAITIYSDYVLATLPDGKERAIEVYNAAIAAELAKRVEYRAGADA